MSQKRIITIDEYNLLMNEIRDVKKRLDRATNNQNPTVPIYDVGVPPQDPVEGQVAIIPGGVGPGGVATFTYAYAVSQYTPVTANTSIESDLDGVAGHNNFITNDSSNFSIASDGTNYGLAAVNAGTYLVTIGGIFRDQTGHRITDPSAVYCGVDIIGTGWTVTNVQLGGYNAPGALNIDTAGAVWTPSLTVVLVAGAGDPLVIALKNGTGETLSANANILAMYLSNSVAGI